MEKPNKKEIDLTQNNLQATNMFEYLLGILTDQSADAVAEMMMSKSDKYRHEHPELSLTAAYSQTLINEVSLHLANEVKSISISRKSDYKQERDSYPIRLSGDTIVESDAFIKAKANLTDINQLSQLMYDMFTATHNSHVAIDRLFKLMVEVNEHPSRLAESLPTDSFLQFSAGINSHTLSTEMLVKALICYVIAVQVSYDNPDAIAVARVNQSCIDLVLINSQAVEVAFTDKNGDDAEYYHVYFQGFQGGGGAGSGYGTADVKSDGIFDKYLLQAVLTAKINLSNVLIISWVKIENEERYNKLNNL